MVSYQLSIISYSYQKFDIQSIQNQHIYLKNYRKKKNQNPERRHMAGSRATTRQLETAEKQQITSPHLTFRITGSKSRAMKE